MKDIMLLYILEDLEVFMVSVKFLMAVWLPHTEWREEIGP